jgi:hypothetical protein
MRRVVIAVLIAAFLAPATVSAAETEFRCLSVPEGMSLKQALKSDRVKMYSLEDCARSIGYLRPSSPSPTVGKTPHAVWAAHKMGTAVDWIDVAYAHTSAASPTESDAALEAWRETLVRELDYLDGIQPEVSMAK